MSTPASIARHPIHPMLVAIPIGLWVFSIVADLCDRFGWGQGAWDDVAFYTIGGGIVGALIAAIPGFMDFRTITDARAGKVAFTHMLVNLVAVAVFAVSFGLRWAGSTGALPLLISLIGLVVLGVGGWLGGELVFVHSMGVNQPRSTARQKPSDSKRRIA
jgi:uncharacterized membrane protein